MDLNNLTVAWVTRKNHNEMSWLGEYLNKFKNSNFKKVVVGYSIFNELEFNYKYIPFWENGLDEKGLLCHKKNLLVRNCETENIVILHADCCITDYTIQQLEKIDFEENVAYGTIGYIENTNQLGFTWLDRNMTGEDFIKLPLEEIIKTKSSSVICGSAIAGKKNIFLNIPWNENLRHNEGEDGELCQRLTNSGFKLVCLPQLIINMKNDR